MKHQRIYIYLTTLILGLSSCGKEFLEIKADKSQQIPTTISDYQALMDYTPSMNNASSHELGVIGADEYYISDVRYQTFPSQQSDGLKVSYQKKAYIWEATIYEGAESTDWGIGYGRILWANEVVDGLSKLSPAPNEQLSWNLAKGCALFHRAFNYYNLAQLYCKVYNKSSASTDLGLPLRKEPDVTTKIPRGTLQATYELIIDDLNSAVTLLPVSSVTVYRPSKAAAFALLARVYLQMGDYANALLNANQSLLLKPELTDFNQASLDLRYPFPIFGTGNKEVLFMNTVANSYITQTALFNADASLLASYTANDLRRKGYYYTSRSGSIWFKGSYSGNVYFFSGLATDEVYLTRAECYARTGQRDNALKDLNYLAQNRYDTSFVPFSTTDDQQLLALIFAERRKELVLRGTRWEDLRRLNKEPAFAKILVRDVDGHHYELPSNDKRYVWQLPIEAIALGDYQQNER